jgi:hypothetical protein
MIDSDDRKDIIVFSLIGLVVLLLFCAANPELVGPLYRALIRVL